MKPYAVLWALNALELSDKILLLTLKLNILLPFDAYLKLTGVRESPLIPLGAALAFFVDKNDVPVLLSVYLDIFRLISNRYMSDAGI